MPPKKKKLKRRITLKQLKYIAGKLRGADVSTIEECVINEAKREEHLWLFEDRKALWCCLTGEKRTVLRKLLTDGLLKFSLYDSDCARGGDRQLRLLIKWNCFSGAYAVPSMVSPTSTALWTELTDGYDGTISNDCRSSVMSSIFAALLTVLMRQVDMISCNLFTIRDSSSHQADSPVFPDDDITL